MTDDDEGYSLPDSWDVIIVGTDLTNSLVAAACASSGLRVLHLDSNSFYGQSISSLPLSGLHKAVTGAPAEAEAPCERSPQPHAVAITAARSLAHKRLIVGGSTWRLELPSDDHDDDKTQQLRESVEAIGRIVGGAAELDRATETFDRRFNIDLAAQPLLGASSFIELLIKTKTTSYIDFRGIDQTLMLGADGSLLTVPSSKADVFNSTTLGLKEKRQLMKFLQLCRSPDDDNNEEEESFQAFLQRQQLTAQLQSFVRHAIVMDRSSGGLSRAQALQRLRLYLGSIGRFPNMNTPFLFPTYGNAELPQAFCRLAAVSGGVYVLRNAPVELLPPLPDGRLSAVRLSNGQTVSAAHFVFSASSLRAASAVPAPAAIPPRLARCVCVTNRSLLDGVDNLLVTVPPAADDPLPPVLAVQLGASMLVAPQQHWTVSFSSAAHTPEQLQAAVDRLLTRDPANHSRPVVLYQASYTLQQSDDDALLPVDLAADNLVVVPDSGLLDGPELYEVTTAHATAILDFLHVNGFDAAPAYQHDTDESAASSQPIDQSIEQQSIEQSSIDQSIEQQSIEQQSIEQTNN